MLEVPRALQPHPESGPDSLPYSFSCSAPYRITHVRGAFTLTLSYFSPYAPTHTDAHYVCSTAGAGAGEHVALGGLPSGV